MVGKAYFASLNNLCKVDKENNLIFLATRSTRQIENVYCLTDLAPSQQLFTKYLNEWRNKDINWFPIYKQQFI